eukprot:m.145845 g.145845  ORF g.145845 m.145845 type:complete len:145 (+) comp15032_c0_seq4:135-569(+)
METHYEVLGLMPDCSAEDIRARYRLLSKELHPDKAGEHGTERFVRVSEAYRVLMDPDLRAAYNASLLVLKHRCERLVEREVDLDSMEDGGDGWYWLGCRCGQRVGISEADMDGGLQVIECSQCNLRFRILYALAEPTSADHPPH